MHLRLHALPLALLALSACPKNDLGNYVEDTTGSASTTASSATTTTVEPTTTTASTGSPTTTGGSSSSTGEPPATTTTGDSETSSDVCAPVGLEACPVVSCLDDWSFSCDDCGLRVAPSACFEIDIGCTYPALTCDLPMPCDRVWGQGYETIETLEDDNAAICLLTALRDGTPGAFEVLWGEMGDAPLVYMTVYSGGGDVVLLEWFLECQGCPTSGAFRRSGQLVLQQDKFFNDCLMMPDTASLTQCVFGFVDFTAGEMPASDYTPPWTTGDCASLDVVCPG